MPGRTLGFVTQSRILFGAAVPARRALRLTHAPNDPNQCLVEKTPNEVPRIVSDAGQLALQVAGHRKLAISDESIAATLSQRGSLATNSVTITLSLTPEDSFSASYHSLFERGRHLCQIFLKDAFRVE